MDQYLRAPLLERRLGEGPRINLPRTPVHRGYSLARIVDEQLTPKKRGLPWKAS